METLAPGLYSVVDGVATPLAYTNGIQAESSTGILGIEIGKCKYKYNGITSGVASNGHFIMVINPDKKIIKQTMKSYDPFIRSMNPDLMVLLPLEVKKKNRLYDEGTLLNGFHTRSIACLPFTWSKVSDTVFKIETTDLKAGEYGFVFAPTEIAPFEFTALLGFTVE